MARRPRRRDVTVSLTTVAMPQNVGQKREFLKSNLVRVIVGISSLTAIAGHWPCHERYAEKRVMFKAANTNNYCELPYEKDMFFQTSEKTNEIVC